MDSIIGIQNGIKVSVKIKFSIEMDTLNYAVLLDRNGNFPEYRIYFHFRALDSYTNQVVGNGYTVDGNGVGKLTILRKRINRYPHPH